MKSIYAIASTSRKPVNQDFAMAQTLENGYKFLVVADGVGSHFKADFGARTACEFMSEKAKEDPNNIDFNSLFMALPEQIRQQVEENNLLESRVDRTKAFGTTLICGLETDQEYKMAYVGNGAILYLRGNFNHFPESSPYFHLPWTLSNLLNPHTLWENGGNILYKIIGPYLQKEVSRPSLLTISKDEGEFGEILILCTDGLYSADQMSLGRADDEKIWISSEEKLISLLGYIRNFLKQESYTPEALKEIVEFYLLDLHERKLIEDDCTLAIIISEKALAYQKMLQLKI